MIILISGKQGSGKTTLANALEELIKGETRYRLSTARFADPMYEIHNAARRVLRSYDIPIQDRKDGALLQMIGDWGRSIDKDVYTKCMVARYNVFDMDVNTMFDVTNVFMIDDLRTKSEFIAFDHLPKDDVLRIRLECDRDTRKKRCSSWREDEHHFTEIDLDDWLDKFEMIFNTEVTPVSEIINIIKGSGCIEGLGK